MWELTVQPRPKLHRGQRAVVVVHYGGTTGRPTDIEDALYGWVTTRDGAMVANEPEAAMTWYPVSDHPTDKATYDIAVTVPRGQGGRRERAAGRAAGDQRRMDAVGLARSGPDGQLPVDRLGRGLHPAYLHLTGRHCRSSTPSTTA